MLKTLSVIIPMYNAAPYIEKCLNSLLLSKPYMDKLDILVVNDGSTDGCESLVTPYIDQYKDSIRLLNKENGGHGSTINYALPFCRGTYLKVLDADDWVATSNIEAFMNYLSHVDTADIVLSPYQTYDIQKNEYQLIHVDDRQCILTMDELTDRWSEYKNICSLHAITYHTDFYRQCSSKLPEHVYYDDAFYSTIPAYQAKKIAITNLPLYVYRIGDVNQSVSSTNRAKRIHQLETVIWSMYDAYDETVDTCNQIYFYRRITSAIADYLITACLRYPVRHSGRMLAKTFMKKLQKRSHTLYQYSRNKFWLLYILSLFGVKEALFCKCMLAFQKKQQEGALM